MGGFQNWRHLFLLQVAKILHKPLAYYSRSFGPFPTVTWQDRRFKKMALDMLHYFDFLSIRDAETMRLADSLFVKYVPAIDTAFLEQPYVNIPNKIQEKLSEKYIVFIPNSLTWHYAYRKYTQDIIDRFYILLMQALRNLYPEHQVLMLPQLCSLGDEGDYNYFQRLLHGYNDDNVYIVPDVYSSDIQQTIISKASLVIGARYHSIVFAINNARPFISLSYEHKMFGLLSILDKEDRQIDITSLGTSAFNTQKAIGNLFAIMNQEELDCDVTRKRAINIATDCFGKFCKNFIDRY